MNSEIPIEYKRMQEKFSLPHFKKLKETFKFELENNNDEVLDHIRVEMSDRIFSFTERIIEPIIAGDETFSSIFEQGMVTDDERKRLFELYKKIQVLKWENNLLMMKGDQKETAKWVAKTWEFWNNELEKKLSELCKKMSINWSTLKFKEEKTTYHG